tara:strand:+ start:859 stop:1656 length:798 start_codon:yes stop_codon:yes gene_type:complete
MGTVNTISPAIEPTVLELKDGDGGRLNLIDQAFSDVNETYEVVTKNLSQENLQFLFLADPPESMTQATSIGVQAIQIGPGKLMKVKDAAGKGVYQIGTTTFRKYSSASANVSSAAALVAFNGSNSATADYEVISTTRGLVRFFSTGSQSLANGNFVGPSTDQGEGTALTTYGANNTRLLKPQSLGAPVRGKGFVIFSRNNNDRQSVREFDCSILPSSANFQIEDFSEFTLSVSVLSDVSQTETAGRYIFYKGDEPTVTPGQGATG